MSRKNKKCRTIILGSWAGGLYDGWGNYDDWDDGYDPFYGYSTNATTTKTEKVIPDFEICPTKPLTK